MAGPQTLVIGAIHTLDPSAPLADAVLVEDGRFAAVGWRACEARARGDARILDLGEGCAVPGLVDAHGHVFLHGRSLVEVSCGAATESECAARVAARTRAVPQGEWIRGRGWDQNRWPGRRFPTLDALTAAAPHHPVVLERVDGHALWVNALALERAGIGAATPDPPGGRILRDAEGRPSGVLVDNAQELVFARLPRPALGEIADALVRSLESLAALGLTSVHDAGVGAEALEVYRDLALAGRLPVRVYAMIDGQVPLEELERTMARWARTPEVGRLAVRAVKLFADGALGSRGAAVLEPYADEPENAGLFLTPPEELRLRILAVARAGFQPAVHAIGDRACLEVLRAFSAVGPGAARLRPRIEHVEVLPPGGAELLRGAGAVASMQPTHCTSDAPWLPSRLGDGTPRLRRACAWRTLLDSGVPLAFGSDFPVESPDPRAGIHAAETRLPPGAAEPFFPEERLSREEALRAYTAGAAHAAFASCRGMIREGFDADLTVFAKDVMAAPVQDLPALEITETMVDGRTVYRR